MHKTHTTTLCLLALLTSLTIAPDIVLAQEDAAEQIGKFSPEETRIRANITIDDLKTGRIDAPILYIHEDSLTQSWRVTITQKQRGTLWELSSVTLPTWFGESYYDYNLSVLPTGRRDEFYALLEASPNAERGAPASAFTMQLAWLVERPTRDNSRWKYISKASQSELDDGHKLFLNKDSEKSSTLIRTNNMEVRKFCGLQSESVQKEHYSPEKRIFINILDVESLLKDTPKLRSHLPPSSFSKEDLYGYVRWILATSDLRTPTDSTTILRPLELGDLDLNTTWSEGAPDDGRGEFVTARISAALPLKGFRIYPGSGTSEEAWQSSPRPKNLLIGLSDGTRFIVNLPPASFDNLNKAGGVVVEFPSPQNTRCLSVLLLDSYPATLTPKRSEFKHKREYEDAIARSKAVTISELTPISVLQGLKPTTRAKETIQRFQNEDNPRRRQRLIRLTRQDGKYIVEALRTSLAKPEDQAISIKDAANILGILRAEDALELILELLKTTPPKGDDWRALRRAAAVHQEELSEPLWGIIQGLPKEQNRRYIDLVRLLGRIAPPEILAQLIPKFGQGTERERNERIRAIAHGKTLIINDILTFIARENISSDALNDALQTLEVLARRHGTDTFTEDEGDTLLTLARNTTSRRPTLRITHILEHARPTGAETFLSRELLLANRDTHIRRAAAKALSTYSNDISGDALREALVDPSPDVRIAAIQSLMQRPDRARISEDVILYVDHERWTEGLRPAIFYLATLNQDDIDKKLSSWITDLSVPTRAYLAAQAFERVRRAPADPTVLTQNLFNQDLNFDMRRQLIEVLTHDTSKHGEEALLSIITKSSFNELEPPRRILILEQEVLMALGSRRSQRAIPLMLRILSDTEQHIKLRRTSLRALSFYADKSLQEELLSLKRDAPKELVGNYEETISTIARRIDIKDAQDSVKELEEKELLKN